MSQDIIADCLNQIMNIKLAKKQEVKIKRYSKFLIEILELIKKFGYIDYKVNEEERVLEIEIKRKLNECRAIKPRYMVKVEEIDKYVRRFLPAKDFGCIFISTNQGLLTHEEALKKKIGGSLIAYVF